MVLTLKFSNDLYSTVPRPLGLSLHQNIKQVSKSLTHSLTLEFCDTVGF